MRYRPRTCLQILHHTAIADDERNHSERNIGQELTARGAPRLVVTVNITEPVEKRMSLALERRILSEGDTIVVAPGQGPSSQVQLTTEPGANFGARRVRTAASPSLAIRATSSTALLRCQTLNGSQPRKLCPDAVL